MTESKTKIIEAILKREGGYVNHPHDRGGETNYGITKETARAYGYNGSMKELPRETAFDIYAARYWDINRLDDIALISASIAEEIADTGVNMGVRTAAQFLQRVLNFYSYHMFDELAIDGIIGNKTLSAFTEFMQCYEGSESLILKALNGLQTERYISITEHNPSQRVFARGWVEHRVVYA